MTTRRTRTRAHTFDVDEIIDASAAPNLSPERRAEIREIIEEACGPLAEPMQHATTQAAVARRALAELQEHVRTVREGARLCGVVTGAINGRVRVRVAGVERELPRPDDVALGIGQTVLLDSEGQIVIAAGEFLDGGSTFVCVEQIDARRVLVRSLRDDASADACQLGILTDAEDVAHLETGDRVLGYAMDGGNVILVTRRLGTAGPATAEVGASRDVRREDLVGLEHIIEETELLFLDASSPALARLVAMSSRGVVGVLFQGEPGTGKSELAQFFAGEVRRRGGQALYRTGPSYLSKWVGVGAAALRADFAFLEESYHATGIRPLLVIDEMESIGLDRRNLHGTGAGHLEVLGELMGIIPRTPVRIIAISNVANRMIDPALLRSGRLRVLSFPTALDPDGVAALGARCLGDVPLVVGDEAADPADTKLRFAEGLSDFIFAPAGPLAELLRVQLTDGRVLSFGAAAFATGAALADGIIRPLVARGVRRDIRAGREVPSPVALEDLRAATIDHFVEWAGGITKDNVRSMLGDRIPEDQAVTKVERAVAPETFTSARA